MTTDKKNLTISMRLAILAGMMTRRAAMMLLVTLTSTVSALAETNGDGTVTVTFNSGIFEGFADTPEAQTINVGSTAQRPDDIRVNAPGDFYMLDFDGWYQDEACENPFNFETPVTENITLYAGYKDNSNHQYSFYDGVWFYYGMTDEAYAMYQKAPGRYTKHLIGKKTTCRHSARQSMRPAPGPYWKASSVSVEEDPIWIMNLPSARNSTFRSRLTKTLKRWDSMLSPITRRTLILVS